MYHMLILVKLLSAADIDVNEVAIYCCSSCKPTADINIDEVAIYC